MRPETLLPHPAPKESNSEQKEAEHMKPPLSWLFLAAAMILIGGCRGEHPSPPAAVDLPPVDVQLFTATVWGSARHTEIAGTVRSVDQAVIAAKVTGTIDKMEVVLGSHVRRGDLLVKINAAEISARAAQAKARLDQAERNLARERKLLGKEAATPENVKSLEETARMAAAAHHEARTMLGYTTITAPFDGVVSRKMAHVGDLASPGVPLLHIENLQTLQIVVSVPEALVVGLAAGDTLPVHIPAAGIDLQGQVAEVAPAVDPRSRSATVRIDIDQAPRLQPGQFARVIIPGKAPPTLFVPNAAVQRFGQMDTVFTVEENRARLRLVRTGAVVDGQVEILAGLEAGEAIVINPSPGFIDGQPVRIVQ